MDVLRLPHLRCCCAAAAALLLLLLLMIVYRSVADMRPFSPSDDPPKLPISQKNLPHAIALLPVTILEVAWLGPPDIFSKGSTMA